MPGELGGGMTSHPVLAPLIPCALVALGVGVRAPWWAAAIAVAVWLAVYARAAGIARGAISAMFATPAVALLVERDDLGPRLSSVAELAAMAAFLLIAVLAGRPNPEH